MGRMLEALAAGELAEQLGGNSSGILVTNPTDVGYLTGFLGGDSWLVVSRRGAVLISDGRFAEELAAFDEQRGGPVRVFIRTGTIIEAVDQVCKELGLTALGVQAESVTLARRSAVAKAVRSGKPGGVKLVETLGVVARLRIIKDAGEVALLKQAIGVQEAALEAALEQAGKLIKKVGKLTEAHLAAILEYEMKMGGAAGLSFETIAGAGANGSLPHYRAGKGVVRKGVPLLIDWGAVVGGYHGDMTRVVCFGKWPAKIAEVFEVVERAHVAAVAALRAGVTGKAVDQVARGVIAEAGYGERFGHSLGHGIGLDIHEEPRLSQLGEAQELKAGMVVTIEPGVYLPGVGGVRLENDYLVTEDGCKNLCRLGMGLEWSTR
jgi:Xaa-Pro aminopeptidase